MLAAHRDLDAVRFLSLDESLNAGERGIGAHFHLLRREAAQRRVIVARRLELY